MNTEEIQVIKQKIEAHKVKHQIVGVAVAENDLLFIQDIEFLLKHIEHLQTCINKHYITIQNLREYLRWESNDNFKLKEASYAILRAFIIPNPTDIIYIGNQELWRNLDKTLHDLEAPQEDYDKK